MAFIYGQFHKRYLTHHSLELAWKITCLKLNWNLPGDNELMGVTCGEVLYNVSEWLVRNHYSGVIMGAMASQITSLTIVYLTVYLGADQRKHQSSASLAFVRRIHRWPVTGDGRMSWKQALIQLQCLVRLWVSVFFCLARFRPMLNMVTEIYTL